MFRSGPRLAAVPDTDAPQPTGSLAARSGAIERWIIGLLIALSAFLLGLGWVLPIMTVETFIILTERISILESCW